MENFQIYVTYIIIGVTALISFATFNNEGLTQKGIFHPYSVAKKKEYWRFLTAGFLHADMGHLFFNMFTLFFFGKTVELGFEIIFGASAGVFFILFYLSAIAVAVIPIYFKHKKNSNYSALGASGGVSAILFSSIIFDPFAGIMIFPIPFDIPAYIFAILYLLYTFYQSRTADDNIGHEAHLYGSLYGMLFTLMASPERILSFIDEFQRRIG